MLSYREFPPAPALRGRVQAYWFLSGRSAPGRAEPIFPDGRPEIVVHLGESFERVAADGTRRVQPRALFAGQIDRPLALSATGAVDVVGVRFRPSGARAFVGAPIDRFRNETPALDDVDARLAHRLQEAAVAAAADPRARAAALDAALLAAPARRGDPLVAAAVERTIEARGAVAVDTLAREAGLSCRQLERRFLSEVGLGPKRFARVVRFQAVLAARARGGVAWAALACDLGYADQAHLVRDFHEFTGAPPTAGPNGRDALGALIAGVSDFDKTAAPAAD